MNDRPVSSGTRIRLFRGTAVLVVIAIAAIIAVVLLTGEKDFVVEGGYQVIGDAVSKQVLAGESSTLSHDDGARIELPQGAISNPATLVIVEVEPPVSTLAVPFAYDFSVAGATLLNPVTVYIPIEPGWADQPSNIHALHWSDEFEDWEPVAGIVDESLLTIAVTTDDLSLFTAVFVEVEATCNVDPTTAQTGRYGQSITFSSTVRAIETPLNSKINVYMKPSFIEYNRRLVSSETTGDPEKTETKSLTKGGSSVTLTYSAKTDYSGRYDFICRLFWEFPSDILDKELKADGVVAVSFDVTGAGTFQGYVNYDGSQISRCGPGAPPLAGETVPLKVYGHSEGTDRSSLVYLSSLLTIYKDGQLLYLDFGSDQGNDFKQSFPIVDGSYTFASAGHYTMDCELWWHAGKPFNPTGTLEEKAKAIGRCIYAAKFCLGGLKALRGVTTKSFEVARARWAAGGVRVSPSILPNEGGDITVTVHSESSTGVQIAAPTIAVDTLGLRLPTLSCGTTDLVGYVSRCWQASFNGANTIPANNSSQGVSYQVTASSVSVPGGGQAASVTVGAPPPPPIVQPPPPTEASDREALIALYDATRGEYWNNNRNGIEVWEVDVENSDISSWHRVTVNSAGRVTELSLYSNDLRYDRDHRNSLPPELGNLTYLWSLHLSGNDLRGRIPDAFGNLGNLVELLLDKNNLSGNIPASLGNLTNLESLDLSDNNLSGEIPIGLGYLPRMDVVYLGGNNLSGCVPAEWRRVQGDLDELGLPYCDVALNDLTINPGRLSPEFEVSESRYTAEVPAYETTITPANYQGASFQFLDAGGNVLTDADAGRPGHQVQVTAATTTVTILVTSRDGREDGSYTIGIARSPGAPGAPVMNPATPGPSTLAISWSAPSDRGTSAISSYSLRYRVARSSGGASAPWTVIQSVWDPPLGSLNHDLTGLQPNVRYELQMRAVNNSGIGPWSATTTGTTVSALPPGAPLNFTATSPGQAEIRLSWGRPSSDGSSPITGYRIQASQDGSTWTTLVPNARPGSLTYSHTALSAGSTWHYRVAAINSAGVGPWPNVATASTVSPVTPQVPGPPVNPAATPEGTTSIRLTWGPPASDGNDAVSGYQLEVSEDGARWTLLADVGPLTTSYTHTSLSPQSARRYRVAAVNSVGLGEWSVVFSATTDPVTTMPVEPPVPGLSEGDGAALVAFYHAAGGPNWANNDNWLTNAPLGEWYGVTTDSGGRVTRLELSDNQLIGTMPAELSSLANLVVLDVSVNQFAGNVPPWLGDLSNLRHLRLRDNRFFGPLPGELAKLRSLQRLSLNGNNLSIGPLPAWIGDLSDLRSLQLSQSRVTGSIPANLRNLTKLRTLDLAINQMTGPIPATLGELSQMDWLRLEGNMLSGPIPPSLGNLTMLEGLHLGGNQLTGTIPSELGKLKSLEYLRISGNRLSSTIPEDLANLSNLRQIALGRNQFTGCVPSGLRNVEFNDFSTLNLPFCRPATGPAPKSSEEDRIVLVSFYNSTDGPRWTNRLNWLSDEPLSEWYGVVTNADGEVVELNLERNGLNGRIPYELGDLVNLETLKLGYNHFVGSIPPDLGRLVNLRSLGLTNVGSDGGLTGEIPPEMGRLTNLQVLTLGGHDLSGELPSEFRHLTNLRQLVLWRNEFSGPIPKWLGTFTELTRLELWSNNFSGPVPLEIGHLRLLSRLQLADNRLSGEIPQALGNLTNLEFVTMSENQLTGCVPYSWRYIRETDFGALGLPPCGLEPAPTENATP